MNTDSPSQAERTSKVAKDQKNAAKRRRLDSTAREPGGIFDEGKVES